MLHITNLKQYDTHHKFKTSLKLWISLERVYRVIKFNQNGWQKSYIDMNTDLRKKAKNDCQKDFCKLMNNAVFGETMGKCEKT